MKDGKGLKLNYCFFYLPAAVVFKLLLLYIFHQTQFGFAVFTAL